MEILVKTEGTKLDKWSGRTINKDPIYSPDEFFTEESLVKLGSYIQKYPAKVVENWHKLYKYLNHRDNWEIAALHITAVIFDACYDKDINKY